jgi:hypothetical protein
MFGGTPNMACETHALPVHLTSPHLPLPRRLRRDKSAFDGDGLTQNLTCARFKVGGNLVIGSGLWLEIGA